MMTLELVEELYGEGSEPLWQADITLAIALAQFITHRDRDIFIDFVDWYDETYNVEFTQSEEYYVGKFIQTIESGLFDPYNNTDGFFKDLTEFLNIHSTYLTRFNYLYNKGKML